MDNRRTMEFFLIAGFLGLAGPICALLGVRDGEHLASVAYPKSGTPAGMAIDFKSVVMGSPGDEEKGRTLFQANCVACHGPMADGKGPAAASLTPPPRNFQDAKARWTRGREPQDIYRTLSEGSPGTAMIGFAASLTVQDRWAIVHYLGTLDGVRGLYHPVDEAMASAWRPEKAR
ncbi:MAG: High-affinity iron permease [Fibrobacteres bacterium]|nr:High-affinity iron permease [Fibrobacterota bacterium]